MKQYNQANRWQKNKGIDHEMYNRITFYVINEKYSETL